MRKTMTTLFLLSIICWFSSITLYVILRIDLFKTIFLVSNLIMTFLGAWVSGYYFRKYEHSKNLYVKPSGDPSIAEAIRCTKEIDELIARNIEKQRTKKQVCKKCVNCKFFSDKCLDLKTNTIYDCNYCGWFKADIVKNINRFNSCKRFEAKEELK